MTEDSGDIKNKDNENIEEAKEAKEYSIYGPHGEKKEEEKKEEKKEYRFTNSETRIAEDELKKTTEIHGEIDFSKIKDIDFLLSIFAEPYDKFKSLQYLVKMREKLLKRGYPETPILNEYLFWTTISRRLQIEYQMYHARTLKPGRITSENIELLKSMKKVAEQITFLQRALNETLDKFEKVSGIADLHQETLDEIEKFVENNIGEFSFKCAECGSVINTQGLPHWAISKVNEPTGEKTYYVFSPEMWFLYLKSILPLHLIAFCLRTSVEGVLITAKRRGEKILKRLTNSEVTNEENKSKRLLKEFEKITK